MRRPKKLSKVCLWFDSVDFKKQNIAGYSRKDPDWSFKETHLGRRYMFLRSATGKIRKIWGGYSPKLYDGHFIELWHEQLDKDLKGADIIADQHFEYGKQFLSKVKLWTPPKEPRKTKRRRANSQSNELSSEERQYNDDHRVLRERVESIFGWIKQNFLCLKNPWAEDEKQMDCVVKFAAAIYNSKLS